LFYLLIIDRNKEIEAATFIYDLIIKKSNSIAIIDKRTLTHEEKLVLYSLVDKNIIKPQFETPNTFRYLITPYTVDFIKDKGYTKQDLKERRDYRLKVAGMIVAIIGTITAILIKFW